MLLLGKFQMYPKEKVLQMNPRVALQKLSLCLSCFLYFIHQHHFPFLSKKRKFKICNIPIKTSVYISRDKFY